ncbi:hypothetical protein ACROYT_G029193 [Oculina patagonica]
MPLPLFLGALVHSRTRSKDLVDTLYRLGLSVSYDRVLGLSADLGNYAISHFETVGTVCPSTLSIGHGVFTTSAVEKIDHDPTATSAHGSFHGTGITLFQYPDTKKPGTEQSCVSISRSGKTVQLHTCTVCHCHKEQASCSRTNPVDVVRNIWEESFVETLSGQHNKMALLKALGDFSDGSNWMSALVQAEIATVGTSNSFLKAVHVKETALAHQIIACALYRLQQASYFEWPECSGTSFEEWCEQRALQSPQFNFWQLNVLSIVLVVLATFF